MTDIPAPTIPPRPITSAKWSDDAHTSIVAEIDGTPVLVPDDPLNAERIAVAQWEAQGNAIAAATPQAAPVPETISDRQFFQQLAVEGVITQDEALAAVSVGEIPAAMAALVSGLPSAAQFGAKMTISGAVEFHRHADLTEAIRSAYGWTPEQTDALWIAASAL